MWGPGHLWGCFCAKAPSSLSDNTTAQGADIVHIACGEGVHKIHGGAHAPNVSTVLVTGVMM